MTIYRASAVGGGTTGTGNRTAAITPLVGDLLIVGVNVTANASATPTMTDGNSDGLGTYTFIGQAVWATSANRMSLFVRNAHVGVSEATTITATTGSNDSGELAIIAEGNSPFAGAAAIRQVKAQSNGTTGQTPGPAFDVAALTVNASLAFLGTDDTTNTTPSGWTERQEAAQTTPTASIQACTRDSGFTGTTVTWGASVTGNWCAIIVELNAVGPYALRASATGGGTSGTADRTATIAPAVGDLFVVSCSVENTNLAPTCSDDNGGTYTLIDAQMHTTATPTNVTISRFVRNEPLPNTTSTTVTVATGSNDSGSVSIEAWSGFSRFGLAAIRQFKGGVGTASTAPTATLGVTPLTGNPISMGVGSGDTTTTQPGGWVEVVEANQATPTVALEIAYSLAFPGKVVTSGATCSTTWGAIVIELDASPALASPVSELFRGSYPLTAADWHEAAGGLGTWVHGYPCNDASGDLVADFGNDFVYDQAEGDPTSSYQEHGALEPAHAVGLGWDFINSSSSFYDTSIETDGDLAVAVLVKPAGTGGYLSFSSSDAEIDGIISLIDAGTAELVVWANTYNTSTRVVFPFTGWVLAMIVWDRSVGIRGAVIADGVLHVSPINGDSPSDTGESGNLFKMRTWTVDLEWDVDLVGLATTANGMIDGIDAAVAGLWNKLNLFEGERYIPDAYGFGLLQKSASFGYLSDDRVINPPPPEADEMELTFFSFNDPMTVGNNTHETVGVYLNTPQTGLSVEVVIEYPEGSSPAEPNLHTANGWSLSGSWGFADDTWTGTFVKAAAFAGANSFVLQIFAGDITGTITHTGSGESDQATASVESTDTTTVIEAEEEASFDAVPEWESETVVGGQPVLLYIAVDAVTAQTNGRFYLLINSGVAGFDVVDLDGWTMGEDPHDIGAFILFEFTRASVPDGHYEIVLSFVGPGIESALQAITFAYEEAIDAPQTDQASGEGGYSVVFGIPGEP